MHVGADAADPGKIEGFIYTDYSATIHFFTWPESISSCLAFAGLFYAWERNPKAKRLTVPLIGTVVVIIAFAILGILFMPAM